VRVLRPVGAIDARAGAVARPDPHYVVDASNVTAAGPAATVLLPKAPWADAFRATGADGIDGAVALITLSRGRGGLRNGISRLWRIHASLPRLARRLRPTAWLTLGDIGPLALPCPHVVFLHLAALAYRSDELTGVPVWSAPKRRYLQWHFGRSASRAAAVVVQTPVMAERVRRRFGVPSDRVVQVAQPAVNVAPGSPAKQEEVGAVATLRSCHKRVRLLFLAAYYPHKNHALLPSLAGELRRRGLANDVHVFTTLDTGSIPPSALTGMLADSDVVTDLGRLTPTQVPLALRASTSLFLPTLLESFGLPYLEAMAAGTPIVTSDRDFARWMCGDCAEYFDPSDAESAVDAILRAAATSREDWAMRAARRLSTFPRDWEEVARSFVEVLDRSAAGASRP
jgi:glycosyltransferase involved in cell wall biosynthesis